MKTLQYIVIAFCLIVGFFTGRGCSPDPEIITNTETVTVTDTVYTIDSIKYEVIKKVPVPYKVIVNDTVYIYKDIDSVEVKRIFNDYFLTRLYNPTIINDTNARIKMEFTVKENKLTEYKITDMVFFQHNTTVNNTETITEKPRGMISIGLGIGYDPVNNGLPLAGKIKYQDKKFRIYGYSYNPFTKIHEVEASFPAFRW